MSLQFVRNWSLLREGLAKEAGRTAGTVVEFGGTATLFPEGVVDIFEGLFKH
jgi:hypothetical protein